jgi:intracellular septation protein A
MKEKLLPTFNHFRAYLWRTMNLTIVEFFLFVASLGSWFGYNFGKTLLINFPIMVITQIVMGIWRQRTEAKLKQLN